MTFDYEAQPKVTVETCNLCGSSDFKPLPHMDRYGLPTKLMKCKACGLRFLNPRMTDEAYVRFYREGHYRRLLEKLHGGKPFGPENIERSQWNYADVIGFVLEPVLNGHRGAMLDIGGSTGVVSASMATKFGFKPLVVEPCKAEADRAKGRGLEVIQGTLDDVPVEKRFDLIMLCQTVEHLTDISGTLQKVKQLLSPRGLFFVDIAKGSASKVDHCFYLDLSTMTRYLDNAGLTDIRATKSIRGTKYYFTARAA